MQSDGNAIDLNALRVEQDDRTDEMIAELEGTPGASSVTWTESFAASGTKHQEVAPK